MKLATAFAVFAGGGIGAVCRYALSLVFLERYGAGFPYATMAINLVGSLLIGIVSQLAVTPLTRTFLAVGLIGGFTTFSTFAFESVTLAGERASFLALLYVCISVVGGLLAAAAGIWIGQRALTM